MSKFAPIGPAHLMRRIKEVMGTATLGDYHFTLAHDVCENQKQWEGLLPDSSTVIIDNGIIELGLPVTWEVMKEASDILGPSLRKVVVLPDVFDDPQGTYYASLDSLNRMKGRLEGAEFMYVVQPGASLWGVERAISSAETLYHHYGVKWVGIPRRVVKNLGTRLYTLMKVREWQMEYPDIKIHLLGFSDKIQDDIMCARDLGVEGIDSAVPLRMGQQGKLLNIHLQGDQAGPRGTYWEDPHKIIQGATTANLQKIRLHINPYECVADNSYFPQLDINP